MTSAYRMGESQRVWDEFVARSQDVCQLLVRFRGDETQEPQTDTERAAQDALRGLRWLIQAPRQVLVEYRRTPYGAPALTERTETPELEAEE